MDSSAAVLQSAGKSSAAERLRDTHRLLVVLVMAHAGEEVDAQGAAGGHRKIGDGPPLVHLGCGSGRGESSSVSRAVRGLCGRGRMRHVHARQRPLGGGGRGVERQRDGSVRPQTRIERAHNRPGATRDSERATF